MESSTGSTESHRLLDYDYDHEIALDINSLAQANQNLRNNNDNNNQNEPVDEQAHPNYRDYEIYERLGSFGRINNIDVGRIINAIIVLYMAVMSIALSVSVIIEWNTPCQKKLQLWAVVQIPIQLLCFFIKTAILKITSKSVDDMTPNERKTLAVIHYFNRLVNFLWMSWFIVGAMLRFGKSDCSAKLLLTTTLIQFIVQWSVFGLIFLSCFCSIGIIAIIWCINPRIIVPGYVEGATKEQIKSLKEIKYNKEDNTIPEENANCAICLCEYENNEKLRFLPCNHHFHSSCIDQWLLKNKSCPFCKREIDSDEHQNHGNENNGNEVELEDV